MRGAIQLHCVSKAYKTYPRKRHKWLEILSFGALRTHKAHWVIQDVDLRIEPGEAVGIVGYNGAGKSTLLKIIAGVTTPTSGERKISGKVASVLELGVGFHPELSGRSNIALAGQLMGHQAAELVAAEEAIIAFAELGEMIDQPLRAYSSGMQARLAFAVATIIRPDILIIDEALSVGDAYFQHKSFARLQELHSQGVTLLFVSHDLSAVRHLCRRILLMQNGKLLRQGNPAEVLDYYNALITARERGA